jgi:hypothetical protein
MTFLPAILVCLCLVVSARGGTVVFSFRATVEAIDDGAGSASTARIGVGDTFDYSYQAAFSLPGTIRRYDGTIWDLSGNETPTFDYFHGELLSGFLLTPTDGGRFHGPSGEASKNYGYLFSPLSGTHTGGLVAGSGDSSFIIFKHALVDAAPSQWQVGELLSGTLQAFDSGSGMTLVHLNVEVTQITQVPEPSAAWLVGLGASAGLVRFFRSFARRDSTDSR